MREGGSEGESPTVIEQLQTYLASLWQKLTKYLRAGVRLSLMRGMVLRTWATIDET